MISVKAQTNIRINPLYVQYVHVGLGQSQKHAM